MKRLDKYNGCFKNLDSSIKVYWFGFIVGDGCIGMYDGYYIFKVILKDKEHVEKLAVFLGYSKDRVKLCKVKLYKNNNYYNLKIGCKELVTDLMSHGLTPRKSLTVDASVIPENYQWDFIRGLWDADGCIYLGRLSLKKMMDPHISLTGNYPLLEGIKNVINDGGCLVEYKRASGTATQLSYGGRIQVERLLNKIYYSEPYLERKFKLYKVIKDYNSTHNVGEHIDRKYTIYKDGTSYYERTCLYCSNKFLVRTEDANRSDRGNNCGRFCSHSHSSLYYWKLRKEGDLDAAYVV